MMGRCRLQAHKCCSVQHRTLVSSSVSPALDTTVLIFLFHRIYKNYDPRAKIIRQVAEEVFQIAGGLGHGAGVSGWVSAFCRLGARGANRCWWLVHIVVYCRSGWGEAGPPSRTCHALASPLLPNMEKKSFSLFRCPHWPVGCVRIIDAALLSQRAVDTLPLPAPLQAATP